MRYKIGLLAFFSVFVFACSSDNNISNTKTQNDLLIEGSPWVYHRAEVIEVINNTTPPKTHEELTKLLDGQNQFLSYEFNRDGTATIFFDENTSHSFDYTFNTEKQIIEFENNSFYSLENTEVTESEFSHTVMITFAPQPGNRVSFIARFIFQ